MTAAVAAPMDEVLMTPDMQLLVPTSPAVKGDHLRVVGGANNGGIIVRLGRDTTSAEASERLATGSQVLVLECEAGRVSYELLTGAGPSAGWVSLSINGNKLLEKEEQLNLKQSPAVAVCWYGQRLAEARQAGKGDFIFDRESFNLSSKGVANKVVQDNVQAELELEAASDDCETLELSSKRSDSTAEDSDGEAVLLCHHCCLPLGEYGYARHNKKEKMMHKECMAGTVLKELRQDEEERKAEEVALKESRREEYEIGWKINMIPNNKAAFQKLGCESVPQGMCCLVLQGDNSVRVAPTFEPASALNMEYLSVALQVRRIENREPLFSLDPSTARDEANAPMQSKRFEPEWLAGTSMGEVMFQADYHLKELSMGEYEQPVIGMKSCFDFAEKEGMDKDWSAREWFVVRKAEVQLSEDDVLVPFLKMGVEAREQIMGASGLEDAHLTRPDHPLVKYAEAFTHNFDLIAERKSVVSQLREVAKASIVAKFMLESGIEIEEAWFSLGSSVKPACCLEVPQLWNERCLSKICVQEGGIVSAEREKGAKIHSVYGGVDFGIDRFRLAAPSRIATSVVAGRAALGRPSSTLMATSQAGLSMAPTRQFTRLAAPLSARASLTAPSRLAAPLSARAGLAAPLSAMSAARPATSLMATSRISVGAPRAGLAAPLSAMSAARPAAGLMATSRLSMAAPQVATARLSMAAPRAGLMATSRLSMAAPQVATSRLSMAAPRAGLMATSRLSMAAPQVATSRLSMAAPRAGLMATSRLSMAAPQVATSRLSMAAPRAGLMATSRLSMAAPQVATSRLSMAAPRAGLMATSRLSMAAPQVAASRLSMAAPRAGLMATSRLSMAAPQVAASRLSMAAPRAGLMATSRLSMAAPQVAASRLSMGMPRGVDLSLDQFNLSAAAESGSWAGTLEAPEDARDLSIRGDAFWSALKDDTVTAFQQEDRKLLTQVFNPKMSDRQREGDEFVPPATGLSYIHKLKNLVKEELQAQEDRKKLFFSVDFNKDKAGPLFPSSWNSSVEIEREDTGAQTLRSRPDFKAEESLLGEVLKSTIPAFDKKTEDGTRFLIYRLGSLEVRASQEFNGERVIGAVFSFGSDTLSEEARDDERIIKVTQYVEKASASRLRCRYYVVFETEGGCKVVTEMLSNGNVAWKANPKDVEDRNSLAKVICSSDCSSAGATVGAVRGFLASDSRRKACKNKQYARDALRHVTV